MNRIVVIVAPNYKWAQDVAFAQGLHQWVTVLPNRPYYYVRNLDGQGPSKIIANCWKITTQQHGLVTVLTQKYPGVEVEWL